VVFARYAPTAPTRNTGKTNLVTSVFPTQRIICSAQPTFPTVNASQGMAGMLELMSRWVAPSARLTPTRSLFLTQIARNALQIPPQLAWALTVAHTASANLDTAGMLTQMMANAPLVTLLLGSQMQAISPALPVLPTLQRAFSVLPTSVNVFVIPAMGEMLAILAVPVRHA